MNRWELHLSEWRECKRCPLHETRLQTVLYRGDIPCDVLFIGEAPGHSENDIGIPFIGEAGHLLQNEIVDEIRASDIRYGFSNLLACIPLGEDGQKTDEPDDDHVKTCGTRLVDLVDFCKPKLIVCIGKHAQHHLDVQYLRRIRIPDDIPRIHMLHPSYILRQLPSNKHFLIKKCIIALRDAINEHVKNERG